MAIAVNEITLFANADESSPTVKGAGSLLNHTTPFSALAAFPFANPTAPFGYWGLSNGTDTGGNYRIEHVAARVGLDPQIVYSNYNGANPVTITAAFEYGGNFYPVYFKGKRAVVLDPNDLVISDPCPLTLPAAATFYTRTFVSVTSGQTWVNNIFPHAEDQVSRSNGETDKTLGGATSYAFEYLLAPVAVIAAAPWGASPLHAAGVGDSIMAGLSDTNYDGWLVRAAAANGAGSVRATKGATLASTFTATATGDPFGQKSLASLGRRIVCHYGNNDLTGSPSLATMQTRLSAIWQIFVDRGCVVYQGTLTPRTTSTDTWATTANQTPEANYGASSTRTQLNDWIRTIPSPLTGYIEVADAVESARNSGLWKAPDYTADGVHPRDTGHAAIAAIVPAGVFG